LWGFSIRADVLKEMGPALGNCRAEERLTIRHNPDHTQHFPSNG